MVVLLPGRSGRQDTYRLPLAWNRWHLNRAVAVEITSLAALPDRLIPHRNPADLYDFPDQSGSSSYPVDLSIISTDGWSRDLSYLPESELEDYLGSIGLARLHCSGRLVDGSP